MENDNDRINISVDAPMGTETLPAFGGEQLQRDGSPIIVEPFYKDPATGATWVHRDLVQVQDAWAEVEHVGPVKEHAKFGDIESFAGYVTHYSGERDDDVFINWNSKRILVLLDYHGSEPGRCQWIAEYPFELSREWKAWMELCGGAKSQQTAVDKLEDLMDGIVEPGGAELMNIIRGLRANVKKEAVSEYLANGDVKVSFAGEASVRSTTGGPDSVTLPATIKIGIPVLKGHVTAKVDRDGHPVDKEGNRLPVGAPEVMVPVVYALTVKLLASVDNDNHVSLRFSIPQAEKVLEEVIVERVAAAKVLLGEAFNVYRAAD